ncbi:MAG TPA: site-2 protease family protein [Candidatus Tectomicrobia bacterium]|nr:site-2 protease family protein [Candidatus Tectomicrobia bacterium]
MFRGSLVLGAIRGIPIRIHFTWLVIFGLLSWSLASGYFPQHYPDLPITAYWIKAIIAALFLFGSVLVHELMHALMAQSLRVPIAGITLFALGGVSEMKQEPPSPSAEFMIAIVGPLASIALAGLFWLVWRALEREGPDPTFAAIALYLVGLNTVVAVFNMLPAFPLDGGRVLRSIVWAITKDLKKATHLATRIGRGFAYILIVFGAVSLFAGAGFQGIWLALIGFFLLQGAQASYTQVVLKEALAGVAVHDIMVRDVVSAAPGLSVKELIERYFLSYGYGGFPVVENGQVLGLVALGDVKRVAPEDHDRVTVREVMVPLSERLTIAPEEDVSAAFQRMAEEELGRLVVMERGRMLGLVTKTGLSRFLQMKLELHL